MASARKKLDEKNLKIVRELVSLPPNKFCFDCGQRGPTYVNVTIGSFVCTKCSGLLRGLTPPHRVKSISMTTFTAEEVDLLRTRGNDYCRRVWLGLYDGKLGTEGSSWDEHAIHQLMLDKYERKRFYMEPNDASNMANNVPTSAVVQHNNQLNNKLSSDNNTRQQYQQTATTTIIRPPPMQQHHNNNPNNIILRNGLTHTHRTRTTSASSALQQQQQPNNGDFVADFDHANIFSGNNNNTMTNGNGYSHGNGFDTGFANFDNNPAFKNSGFPLASSNNRSVTHTNTPPHPPPPPPVAEDKYAALKDLDQSLHQSTNPQATTIDWGGSTSSLYSSPLSSSYGSPTTAPHYNPFNTNLNGNNDMWTTHQNQSNLFEPLPKAAHQQSFFPSAVVVPTSMVNGHSNGQASLFAGVKSVSAPNPFDTGFVAAFPPLSSASVAVSNGMNGTMQNGNRENHNVAWNCQNPFKLASNGSTNNPFL